MYREGGEMKKWIQAADKEMEEKGTKGAFGKATRSKIAKAKAKGGIEKKRAVFAQNMRAIADEHKHDRKGARHTKVARKKA